MLVAPRCPPTPVWLLKPAPRRLEYGRLLLPYVLDHGGKEGAFCYEYPSSELNNRRVSYVYRIQHDGIALHGLLSLPHCNVQCVISVP